MLLKRSSSGPLRNVCGKFIRLRVVLAVTIGIACATALWVSLRLASGTWDAPVSWQPPWEVKREHFAFSFHSPQLSDLARSYVPVESGVDGTSLDNDPRSPLLQGLLQLFTQPWTGISGAAPGSLFAGRLWNAAARRVQARASELASCAALIRIVSGRVFVRQSINDVSQPYRTLRLNATVAYIKQALLKHAGELGSIRVEFLYNTCDHPLTTDASVGRQQGTPVFSPSYSSVHLDIPVPDPMDFTPGYVLPDDLPVPAWKHRRSKAVFLGSPHAFYTTASNYMVNHRLRLKYLAMQHPDLLDVYLRKYHVLSPELVTALKRDGIQPDAFLPDSTKASYKYLVTAAGGVHSASVCGAFRAGQVPIIHAMAYGEYFYAALRPGTHFIPVDRAFTGLIDTLAYLRDNDRYAEAVASAGHALTDLFCTDASRVLYWGLLLRQVQRLQEEAESIMVPTSICAHRLLMTWNVPGHDLPRCSSLSPAELKATRELERQVCHALCLPSTLPVDEKEWYWVEAIHV